MLVPASICTFNCWTPIKLPSYTTSECTPFLTTMISVTLTCVFHTTPVQIAKILALSINSSPFDFRAFKVSIWSSCSWNKVSLFLWAVSFPKAASSWRGVKQMRIIPFIRLPYLTRCEQGLDFAIQLTIYHLLVLKSTWKLQIRMWYEILASKMLFYSKYLYSNPTKLYVYLLQYV